MKITTRLLFIAALFALVLPLVFTGNAGAVVYNPDGLSLNPATGMWELPVFGSAGIAGCYDGTTTINDTATTGADASRFKCYNLQGTASNAFSTQSTCVAIGVTPTGWNATASIARWSACSKGGYSANTTNALTDCATNGGMVDAFSRCNRSVVPADCASLPTYTWTSAGTSAATYACTTTGMNVAQCTAFSATATSGATVVGSAAYNIGTGVTTCSVYIADATACTTQGGSISTANTDETRGYCGPNWVFKTGTTGDFGSSIRNNCTKCHNPIYMASAGTDFEDFQGALVHSVRDAGTVSQYMNASHKNASRKIPAAGFFSGSQGLVNVWLDTAGEEHFGVFPYVPGGFSGAEANQVRRIDWVNGKIEDTTGGLKNLPTNVFTEWYWEFGYYGEDPERGVFNAETASTGKPIAKQQACFACHATGYTMSNTKDTTKEPEKSFLNISWDGTTTYTVGSRPGVVNFVGAYTNRTTNVKTTSTYGMWDQYGVVCAKCHNAAGGSHTSGGDGVANPSNGYAVNAVCGQCHIRAGSGDWAVTAGTGALTVRSAVGTGHPNWHETDFLNSPHARYTGTYGQVATSSLYNSQFGAVAGGGCTGCHNPHGTVRGFFEELAIENDPHGTEESLGPLDGVEHGCKECHANKADITLMNHPYSGGLTPADTEDACATCHMPGGRHLFRITTDTNYTTTQATAFPLKPDGSFTQAVWIGLKEACGQCHDGQFTSVGIPHLTRAEQQAVAIGIHSATNPRASFTAIADSSTSFTVNFNAANSTCPTGSVCEYDWDFGDGGTGTGMTTSHTYADGTTVTVELSVTTGITDTATATRTVTPLAVNQAPTCSTETIAAVNKGTASTFTDASTDVGGSTVVYVSWGDGSGMATGALGSTFNHTYANIGTYSVRKTVRDSLGASCVAIMPAVVNNPAVGGTSGTLNITTADSAPFFTFSYAVKQNGLTKKSGSGTTGTPVAITGLPSSGTFKVYLYYATGHTCTFANGVTNYSSGGTAAATACN